MYGVLEADVVAEKLIVREGGVRGTIQSDEAEIHGVVEGNLTVHNHLDIRQTGYITGDVIYGSMATATGGRLQGNIHVRDEETDNPATTANGSAFAEVDEPDDRLFGSGSVESINGRTFGLPSNDDSDDAPIVTKIHQM